MYETGEDANTELTVETISESITYYVMDTITGYSQVLMELDENKEAKVLYTRGDGLVSREQLLTNGETKTSLYLSDGHGDVRQLTDTNGNITDTYRYNAYGELAERTGNTDNPYLYTGEYYDEGTGLYYLRARYMNPETGTFISMDSYLGNSYDPASLHRYTYAQNNPQMYNDPSGHFAGLIGAQVNLACSEILRNHQALHMMGMVNGMMNSILNQVLGTGSDPVKDFLLGYVTGYGLGAAYYIATALVVASTVDKVLKIAGLVGASISTIMNVSLAIQEKAAGNNKNAVIYLTLGVFSAVAFCKLLNIKGIIKATGSKGTATFESGSSSKYYNPDGSPIWPPNRGFDGNPTKVTLETGTLIDRYGYDGGTFVSPKGTSYTERALPIGTDQKPYTVFEVVKPIEVQAGKIAPWFGEKGGGIQYEFSQKISDLLEQGILRKVQN